MTELCRRPLNQRCDSSFRHISAEQIIIIVVQDEILHRQADVILFSGPELPPQLFVHFVRRCLLFLQSAQPPGGRFVIEQAGHSGAIRFQVKQLRFI